MAEHIIVDHGDTTRWEPGQVMRPSAPSPEPTWDGPRTRGWRVTGQAHRLRVEQLFLGPRRRAVDEREAIDIPVRTAKRTLARRAKAALTANPDAPERQREAYRLVRVIGAAATAHNLHVAANYGTVHGGRWLCLRPDP